MKNVLIFVLAIVLGIITLSSTISAVINLLHLNLIPCVINTVVATLCWKGCEKCFDEL